jgi:hypothetical protein
MEIEFIKLQNRCLLTRVGKLHPGVKPGYTPVVTAPARFQALECALGNFTL